MSAKYSAGVIYDDSKSCDMKKITTILSIVFGIVAGAITVVSTAPAAEAGITFN